MKRSPIFLATAFLAALLLTPAGSLSAVGAQNVEDQLSAIMETANLALLAEGAAYRVAVVEYLGGPDTAGGTVLSKIVGNKQLAHDFVPGDARRAWSADGGNAITYAIDTTGDAVPVFGGLTGAETDAAIVRSMDSWEAVACSQLGLIRVDDFGLDIGLVAFQNGLGGSPFAFADIQHAGWLDINFAGGILGATFTFIFIDGLGNPTDIDGNGKVDTALREIYYDPSWNWADDGVSDIDVESVALHEAGHGLSQAHFGTVRIKNNGELKASPRAVMNALYSEPLRELLGTDNGGHCSNWGQWPLQ